MIAGKRLPLVSVGMSVHNCLPTVSSAVRSILAQSYQNWELILIDDGSTDGTAEIIVKFKDPRIRIYVDGEHKGLIARLNEALLVGQGDYFARMDGDDVSYPQRFEKQVEYLNQNPDIDLVGAWVVVFGHGGSPMARRAGPVQHKLICARPYLGFPIAHPTYMGRTVWFRQYKYYVKAVLCEDQDLLLRSYESSKFANYPEILLGYREERLILSKAVKARINFARSLLRIYYNKRQYLKGSFGAILQVAKLSVDSISTLTHVNYRESFRRRKPLNSEEINQWNTLWTSVN